MTVRWRWVIVFFGGAAVAATLVAVVLLQTAPARSRALAWLVTRVRADAGIELEAERLDYNLFTLSFRITKVRLRAEAGRLKPAPTNEAPTNEAPTNAEAVPFFEADEVSVDLPWAAIRGALAIESLHLTRPRVTLVRGADGTLNLPTLHARGGKPLDRLPIGPVSLTDGSVSYVDPQRTLNISVSGIDADLTPIATSVGADLGRRDGSVTPVGADLGRPGGSVTSVGADFSRPDAGIAGTLVARQGLHAVWETHESIASRFDARVAYDGSTVSIDPLTLTAPEGALELKGRLTLLGVAPRIDASYRSTVDVGRLARWWPAAGPVSGTVALTGRVLGPLARPVVTAELAGGVAGGTMTGTARLSAFGDAPENVVAFDYQDLDLAHVLTAARVTPLPRLAARLDGRGQASWRTPWLDTLRATLESEAAPSTDLPRASRSSFDRLRANDESTGSGQGPSTGLQSDARSSALGVKGRLTLQIDRGAWTLRHTHQFGGTLDLSGVAHGRLDASNPGRSSLTGDASVHARDVTAALTALDAAGIETRPLVEAGIAGNARVAFTLSGTLSSPRASGEAEIAGFRTITSGPADLRARLDLDTARLEVADLELTEATNRLHANGRVDFTRRALAGELRAEAPAVGEWLRVVPPRWRPAGSVAAGGRIGGTIAEPRLDLSVTGHTIDVAGQRVDRLAADVRVIGGTVFVDKARLAQGERDGGRLAIAGRYAFGSGECAVRLDGTSLDIRPIPGVDADAPSIPIAARADVEFQGAGSIDRPGGQGRLQFHRLAWDRFEIGPSRAEIVIEDGTARVDLRAPDLRLTVNASASLVSPHQFALAGTVSDGDVARWTGLAAGPGRPFSGTATVRFEASGDLDRLSTADAEVALDRLDVGLGAARLTMAGPARVRYASGQLAASTVEFRSGTTRLRASGLLSSRPEDSALTLDVDGDLGDVGPWLAEFTGAEIAARGALRARVRATGTAARPLVDGDVTVEAGTLTMKGVPPVTALELRAVLRDGVLQVSDLNGEWQGSMLTASARVPAALFDRWLPSAYVGTLPPGDRAARVTAKAAPITKAVLAPWLEPATLAQIEGDAAASLTAETDELRLDRVRGELTLDRLALSLARAPFDQERPTRLAIASGRLSVVDWTWGGPRNRITVTGDMTLEKDARLDVQVRGASDLRSLGAFIPGAAAAGEADLDVRVRGAARDPEITGTIAVKGGELRVRQPRVAITDFAATIDLASDRLVVRDGAGSVNGGALRVDGELRHDKLALTGGALNASGRGVAFEWPKGLRTELNGDLVLTPIPAGATISGKVIVRRGAYRDPLVLSAQVVEALRASAAAALGAEAESPLNRLQLNITVVTDDDVVVDNNYGQFEIGADLRLAGTIANPTVGGRATLGEGGKLFLGGNVYRVERGTIDFVDPQAITPDLNFTARTRVSSYDITLAVSGTPDTIKADLTSDPPLGQSDIISLVVTGQLASEVGIADSQQLRGQMLTYLSGDLLGLVGQRVGFDAVRLERGTTEGLFGADPALLALETDPGARLSLTKRLSRRVEIVLSQNLREDGGITWIAVYRPGHEVDVRGVSRDDNSKAAELSQQLNFGGASAARKPSERRTTPHVSSVQITGTPGFPESDLRSRLRLGVADRFDFYGWQDDRDALERFYRERGYLEARIAARRAAVDGADGRPSIALEYAIDAGPPTTLIVRGYEPSDRLRRELEDAWADAVFDGFLLADLRATLTAALARDGYLRAEVAADVEPPRDETPPRKRILVRVAPGPPTRVKTIDFRGNRRIPADRLQAIVRQRGLNVTAWLAPAELDTALRSAYASEGMLAASVSIDAPRFDGETAVLPVTIAEGPVFDVSEVRVEGARGREEADVRTAFGIQAGQPYQPARVDEGRRAVEAGYRRVGFNHIRSRVTQEIDREGGRVALGLVVTEGPRQVLADVAIEGAGGTRQEVVARALAAKPGSPVNLEDWYQARKRLYETGVFRSADIEFEPVAGATGRDPATEPVRAKVTLDEWQPYRFRYGFQAGDEINPYGENRQRTIGVIADLQRRNLFGRAMTGGLTWRYEADLWLARGFVSAPRIFTLPLATSLFLTRSSETVNPGTGVRFITEKTTATLQQETKAGRKFRISYGYRFERNHLYDPDAPSDDPFALDVTINIARLTGALFTDTRNDPFDPARGWFNSSNVEYGAEAIGSQLRFVKFLVQESYFHQFAAFVVASGVRLGGVRGLNQVVVPSERFFAGGANTVRGYKEDSLGPADIFGEPAGGNALLVFNQELRFPVYRWVRGVGFVDAGNVFEFVSDVRLSDLKVGAGLGLRFNAPFAMFRLDYGVPVPRRANDPRGRWYFSLGHVF